MSYNENDKKIRSFTDLDAWKEAHKLAILIYSVTFKFPSSEQFGLTNQMRRASVSISSNIAEGFSRNTKKDKIRFYSMAKASLSELQNQSLLARDVKIMLRTDFDQIAEKTIRVGKLLTGLLKSATNK